MTHGPCGVINNDAPCMIDDGGCKKCSKDYPKEFREFTEENEDGYPLYRRRDNGRKIQIKSNKKIFELDNRWIVPYNPYLTTKYNCHINVEICSSVYIDCYIF